MDLRELHSLKYILLKDQNIITRISFWRNQDSFISHKLKLNTHEAGVHAEFTLSLFNTFVL